MNHVELKVGDQQTMALLGRTGVGKTTPLCATTGLTQRRGSSALDCYLARPDRVYGIETGGIVFEGATAELEAHPEIRDKNPALEVEP